MRGGLLQERRRAIQIVRRWRRQVTRARRMQVSYAPSLGWASPLRLTRHRLEQAVRQRANFAGGRLLDVGCGNQPYRGLFTRIERYIGLDTLESCRADVHGDGLALPFRDDAFDTVLCNQVLEHVPEPGQLMEEIVRVLKPAGTLLLTAPQTWGLHREPHDFYRYTTYGLRYLAEKHGLHVVEIAPTCGLWATLAQRIVDTVVYTYAARSPRLTIELLSILLVPVLLVGDLVDRLAGKRGDTLDYIVVATKAR